MARRSPHLVLALSLSAVVAGGCTYTPGKFSTLAGAFPGARARVGCLDVAVARHVDGVIEGPAATFTFGNRCNGEIVVDLGAIVATGRGLDGAAVPLRVYDPEGVIGPSVLDGRRHGAETLEYQFIGGALPLTELCLDLSRLDTGAGEVGAVEICVALDPVAAAPVAVAGAVQ